MDSTQQTAPTNNFVVFGFCELCGLIFGLPPGEDFYHGAPVTTHMVIVLLIGLSFAVLGPSWPWLKSRFSRRLSATLVRAASDFRWWLGLLLFFFLYTSFGSFGIFALDQDIAKLQADMQHYVLPRELTDQQIKSIHDYLVAHPQPNDATLSIIYIYDDSEVTHYANRFFQAIRGTGSDVVEGKGWTVQMESQPESAMLASGVNEGIEILDRFSCKPGNGLSKTAMLLQAALSTARMDVVIHGGCEPSRTDGKVSLVVSRRPKFYQPRMKMLMVPAD
jgi:hypothetical protein